MLIFFTNKDPREYLPFLRELRALPKFYQRYKIDDHLRRYTSALQNLRLAGPEYFEEVLSYVERHVLYQEALHLWRDSREDYKVSRIKVNVVIGYEIYIFMCSVY